MSWNAEVYPLRNHGEHQNISKVIALHPILLPFELDPHMAKVYRQAKHLYIHQDAKKILCL